MTRTRSAQPRMPRLRADRLIVGGSLLLLASTAVISAIEGTALRSQLRLAQNSDAVNQCMMGCDSMRSWSPPASEDQISSCRSGCSSMTASPTGGGCSGSQPNWPDCAMIECQNNAWTCTQMRSSAGTSYSPPSGGWGSPSTMRNCTYPNATKSGQSLTAFCEGDYYNCRNQSTGESLSNDGLSLGAPSTCESGWNTTTGGASSAWGGWSSTATTGGTTTTTSGNGTTENQSPYQLCVSGCGGTDNDCYRRYCSTMQGAPAASSASTAAGSAGASASFMSSVPAASSVSGGMNLECVQWTDGRRNVVPIPSGSPTGTPCTSAAGSMCTFPGGITCTVTSGSVPGSPGGSASSYGGYTGTMRNCFYPNATMNGTYPGYTVWCQGSYENCRRGDPSGTPVSISGLSLGAPSVCDSSGGGGSSQGGYSSGGYPQTGGMRNCTYPHAYFNNTGDFGEFTAFCESDYVNCKRVSTNQPIGTTGLSLGAPSGCEFGMSSAGTQGTGGASQCFAECSRGISGGDPRYEECRNRCYGSTGTTPGYIDPRDAWISNCVSTRGLARYQCVTECDRSGSGCPASGYQGGGYSSGPVFCTYPNGTTLYCESPHIRCRRSMTDSAYLTNQEVGANGATANCVPASQGGGASSAASSGGAWTPPPPPPPDNVLVCCPVCNDPRGFCSMMPCFETQTPQPGLDCRPRTGGGAGGGMDMSGLRRDAERNLSEYDRQLGEMNRAAQEMRVNAGSQIADFKTAIAKARSCMNGAATPEAFSACVNYETLGAFSKKVWDAIQTAGAGRQLEDAAQQLTQMPEFIRRMKDGGVNVSRFETLFNELKAIVEKAKANPSEAHAILQRFYEVQGQFWESAESAEGAARKTHMGRGLSEGCERIRLEGSRQGQAVAAQLDGIVRECLETVARLTTSENVAEWQVQEAMKPLWQKFEAVMQSAWGNQECRDAEYGTAEVRQALTRSVPEMIQDAGKKNPGIAREMETLRQQGLSILERAERELKGNNCKSALKAMSDMEKMRDAFESIMERGGLDTGDEGVEFVDHSDDYEYLYRAAYEDEGEDEGGGEDNYAEFTGMMKDRGYRSEDLALLKQVDPRLIKEYMNFSAKTEGHDVVRAAAAANLSVTNVEELMATKTALLEEIEALKEERKSLQASIRDVLEQIRSYTFNPALAKDVSALIKDAPVMNAKAFGARYEELAKRSKELNVAQGIAAYMDVDPFQENHGWFAGPVKEMTERGIFKGVDGRNFAPEQTTNVAETLVVAARLADLDTAFAEPSSAFARGMPAWAYGAAAALEEEGVPLQEIFAGRKAADPATRLQIARILAETMDLPEADASAALQGFKDGGSVPAAARDDLAAVVGAGIMRGANGVLDLNGSLTRGMFATLAARTVEATTEEGTWAEEEEEESWSAGTAGAAVSPAASSAAGQSSAAASSAPAQPSINLHEVKESDFRLIQALVSQWILLHRKEPAAGNALVVQTALQKIDRSNFGFGRDTTYTKLDLQLQLLEEDYRVLEKIVTEMEQPAAQ